MQVSIQINNASESMIKALKAMLKTDEKLDYTFKKQDNEQKISKRLQRAIDEVNRGDVIRCKDFEDFKQKVLSWSMLLNTQNNLKNH